MERLTGNIIIKAKKVRFSLSPKITLTKEKTRKNSESEENSKSFNKVMTLHICTVQLFLNSL